MTSDLENQLRAVFNEDASHALSADAVSERVLLRAARRTSRRRVVVVLAAAAAVVVAVIVPVIAFRGGDSRNDEPSGTPSTTGCPVRAALWDEDGVGVTAPSDCSFVPVSPRGSEYRWPELSPDGTRLVYVDLANGPHSKLVLTDVATGRTRVLVDDLPTPRNPTWSPDGRRIAFDADNLDFDQDNPRAGSSPIIEVYDLASGATTIASVGSVGRINPAWSPDGRSLLLVEAGENGALVRVDLDTGIETDLPRYWTAGWSPDGDQVVALDVSWTTGLPTDGEAVTTSPDATAEARVVVLDATTGLEVDRSSTFTVPASPFLENNSVAWDDAGIVAAFGATLVTFDEQLHETGRTMLPAGARLGFDFR